MKAKLGAAMPSTALIANGADSTKFFDALSMSPISNRNRFPLLLVAANSVPAETAAALTDLALTTRYIAGGTNTVSESVASQLGVPAGNRLAGSTRYTTATTIANRAIAEGWNDAHAVGLAAKLPDALSGGAAVGSLGGVLIITPGGSLDANAATMVSDNASELAHCYIFGGTNSVSAAVKSEVDSIIDESFGPTALLNVRNVFGL